MEKWQRNIVNLINKNNFKDDEDKIIDNWTKIWNELYENIEGKTQEVKQSTFQSIHEYIYSLDINESDISITKRKSRIEQGDIVKYQVENKKFTYLYNDKPIDQPKLFRKKQINYNKILNNLMNMFFEDKSKKEVAASKY